MSVPKVCFPFVGQILGGCHFSVLPLIKGLDPARFQAQVLMQDLVGPIYDFFRDNGVEIVPAPPTPQLVPGKAVDAARQAALIAAAPRLARALRENGVDIVHLNDGRTNATWALPAKLSGARLVWHNRGNPNAAGLRFLAPFVADRVISVSAFASPKPGLLSAAARNEVVFSPFDTDVHEDRDAARGALIADLGAVPATKFVGYFGAFVERKRPLLFVDTIAAMRKAAPDKTIVGVMFGQPRAGDDDPVRKRIAEHGLGDSVKLMGFRSPGSRWIAACDLLLVPAFEEPLGRTLVEAMLVGTPVVATRSGGNTEAIEDGVTGWTAPAENAEALARAALHVFTAPDLAASVVRQAAKDARARFGERRHLDAVMAIYDELLTARAPGRRESPA
ncbi:MAG: glycosyltransferase family 4 protein [Parvularculaceae bacterium]|nr:glycosyltransferase family 4 protein [Parvularculaceae bacterium]